MEHAKLWKRILNEGVFVHPEIQWKKSESSETFKNSLESLIMASVIICDPRPACGKTIEFSKCAISFPFPLIWIEHANRNTLRGCLMHISSPNDDGKRFVSCDIINGIKAEPLVYDGRFSCEYDASGLPVGQWQIAYCIPIAKKVGADFLSQEISLTAGLAMTTLEILNCKNVSLKWHDGDPKQVRRAVKRHGGTPDKYRYHTLVVRPPGHKSRFSST